MGLFVKRKDGVVVTNLALLFLSVIVGFGCTRTEVVKLGDCVDGSIYRSGSYYMAEKCLSDSVDSSMSKVTIVAQKELESPVAHYTVVVIRDVNGKMVLKSRMRPDGVDALVDAGVYTIEVGARSEASPDEINEGTKFVFEVSLSAASEVFITAMLPQWGIR